MSKKIYSRASKTLRARFAEGITQLSDMAIDNQADDPENGCVGAALLARKML
jgi:hypothetical protein